MLSKPPSVALAAVLASAVCSAQDASDLENCVSLAQVDHTEVVDKNTILFYMDDNKIYRNTLPISCPGLRPDKTFMYRVTINQLCNVDVITVLDDLGFGFLPGASCGLGKFQPISEATADEIKSVAERAPTSDE